MPLPALAAVAALAVAAHLSKRGSRSSSAAPALEIRFERWSKTAPIARAFVDGVEVGHLQASFIDESLLEENMLEGMAFHQHAWGDEDDPSMDFDCLAAIRDLRVELKDPLIPVYTAWRSEVAEVHKGRGYGVRLYEAMLDYLERQRGGPVILIPEACLLDGGSTSLEAWRVWDSLSRRYLGRSNAVASRRRGSAAMAPGSRRWKWTRQDWRDWKKKCGAQGTRTPDGRPALCLPFPVIERLNLSAEGRKILRDQAEAKWAAEKGQRIKWHPVIRELHRELEASMPEDNPRLSSRAMR